MLEFMFKAAHVVVLVGWVALVVAPLRRSALIGIARLTSALLAGLYTIIFLA